MESVLTWLNANHGIWTGIISGFIFLLVVFVLFKPWFLISGKISENNGVFRFKMINITFWRCVEFRIFLRKVVVHDLKRGCNHEFEILELKKDPFIYVPSIFGYFRASKPNCLQLTTEKNVRNIIEATGYYVELIIIAKHGLTSLQSTYKKRFKSTDCIEMGSFNSGMTFKISNK